MWKENKFKMSCSWDKMVNCIFICWEEMCGMSDILGGFDWFFWCVLGC